MSEERRRMLARIRAALADVPPGEHPGDTEVPREYRRGEQTDAEPAVALFAQRVGDYDARVSRVAPGDALAAIEAACRARQVRRLLIPADLPERWRPTGPELVEDQGLTATVLDGVDGVLTGCATAIALTGTIALDAGPAQGRRAATLVPDYHLCVVEVGRIVSTVPEGLERLAGAASQPDRPITLISGPSATSDIELVRVDGVHGPRTLEVLIVG